MKNLFILMDNSHSMTNKDSTGFIRHRLLCDKIIEFLRNNSKSYEDIRLYSFSETINLITKDKDKLIDKLSDIDYYGRRTRIWDSINEIIDFIKTSKSSQNADNLIICLTDGNDNASRIKRTELFNKIKTIKNIEVRIIDISSQLAKEDEDDPIVKIDYDIEKLNDINVSQPPEDFNISVPIFPLIKTDKNTLDIIRKSLIRAIPYIEDLTGLRYYPVPTLIVDDNITKKERKLQFDPEELKKDIQEIIKFILAVSITFHTCEFNNYIIGNGCDRYNRYKKYCRLSDSSKKILIDWAETAYGLWYLDNMLSESHNKFQNFFIPELSEKKDILTNTYDNLIYMIKIMEKMHRDNKAIMVKNSYIKDRSLFPKVIAWEKHLSKAKFKRLLECIDENGQWKLSLQNIIKAMKISVEIIFVLIKELRSSNHKYQSIIDNIRTYGMYYKPSSDNNHNIKKHLKKNGYPDHMDFHETGMVLICLNPIEDDLKKLENVNDIDLKKLKEDLIQSVIIHEHTHAIIEEGIDKSNISSIPKLSDKNKNYYTAVNEGLAEWAELNYFRKNEIMYKIIRDHAESGKLPEWPYSSALLIEKSIKTLGTLKFKILSELIRKHINESYSFLIGK